MKLTGKTCYSHLVSLMCSGPLLEQAVHKISYKAPVFSHEGCSGYIETEYEIDIRDLHTFTRIWSTWYSLSSTARSNLYGLAKGLGDCK